MFLPHVSLDGHGQGETKPVLAEHWDHSSDYRIWTLKLRKNVKWHDGVPATVHDIKFTMDLRQSPVITSGDGDTYVVEVLDVFNWKESVGNGSFRYVWHVDKIRVVPLDSLFNL